MHGLWLESMRHRAAKEKTMMRIAKSIALAMVFSGTSVLAADQAPSQQSTTQKDTGRATKDQRSHATSVQAKNEEKRAACTCQQDGKSEERRVGKECRSR